MKIVLTARASQHFSSIKNYLAKEWGEKVAEAFEQKTIDLFGLLKLFPEMGTIEVGEKQIYGFQLTKQTRIFYRIKGDQIIILAFFDVRQNPERRSK